MQPGVDNKTWKSESDHFLIIPVSCLKNLFESIIGEEECEECEGIADIIAGDHNDDDDRLTQDNHQVYCLSKEI